MPQHQPKQQPRFSRRDALKSAVALGVTTIAAAGAPVSANAAKPPQTYDEALEAALAAMENGRHDLAGPYLKAALTLDRNDPNGLVALGTLYLHTGSFVRAARTFDQALVLTPTDPLARFGAALAALARRAGSPAGTLAVISADAVPAAPLVAAYARLLAGDAAVVREQTAGVDASEPNLLRLALAAFAALRGGDAPRGETLLKAWLARPESARLAEDRAFILPFDPGSPGEPGTAPLISAVEFAAAPAGEQTYSGLVTLSPGGLPRSVLGRVAFVSYALEGGWMNATTNSAPFTVQFNSARLPNGLYNLRVTCYDTGARPIQEKRRTLRVKNADAPRPAGLGPEREADVRRRLTALLSPRPARKAAHFALAERAAGRGDGASALQHIESVVAIDPNFRNARASLRRYNLQVLGPRNGVWRAGTSEKLIALTFDDGPNPAPNRTPALLQSLAAENARATFFVVGLRVEQSPGLVKQMTDAGHEIGNHSYSHPNLALMDPAGVERELGRTSVLVRQITGARPRFYRPPGGNVNAVVQDAAESLGMAGAFWTVDAIKQEEAASRADLARYVLNEARPGAIILLHNAPDVTVAAVPAIVRGLRQMGYELVTMSELVRRTGGRTAPVASAKSTRPARGGYGG